MSTAARTSSCLDLAVTADPQVRTFFEAGPDEATGALAALLEKATAVITRLACRKFRTVEDPGAEEIISEARTQITTRLFRLRNEWRDGQSSSIIADFAGYVASMTHTIWVESLRRRHPARAMLLNRLRYLLEDRTDQRGFALWNGPAGERLCGFAVWRGRAVTVTPRLQRLLADPVAAASDALGARGEAAALPLAGLVSGLLSWLGGPLELPDLLDAVAELHGVARHHESLDDPAAPDAVAALAASPNSGPSPHDQLRWKESLTWLWRETLALSLRQRTAYLLHSTVLRELEILGLASVRQAAAVLELPPERVAALWNDIPLDDRTIASLLGASCQQVINLRKVARQHLGRAWQQWSSR